MTTHTTTPDAIKVKHRALWASGDYPAVATQVIAESGVDAGRRGRDPRARACTGRRCRLGECRDPGCRDRRRGDRK